MYCLSWQTSPGRYTQRTSPASATEPLTFGNAPDVPLFPLPVLSSPSSLCSGPASTSNYPSPIPVTKTSKKSFIHGPMALSFCPAACNSIVSTLRHLTARWCLVRWFGSNLSPFLGVTLQPRDRSLVPRTTNQQLQICHLKTRTTNRNEGPRKWMRWRDGEMFGSWFDSLDFKEWRRMSRHDSLSPITRLSRNVYHCCLETLECTASSYTSHVFS